MTEALSIATSSRKKCLRLFLGICLVLGLTVLARQYQIPSCANIQNRINESGSLGPFVFVAVYIFGTVLFLPGVLLTLVGGMAFGPWWGTLLVSIASVTGATVAFLVARYIARDLVEVWLRRYSWFESLKIGLDRGGLRFVLFVRIVPLFPFNALNYACGLLPLRKRDYLLGSLLGMLPATFAYVYLGATGCRLVDVAVAGRFSVWDMPEDIRLSLLFATLFLVLLSVLPVVLKGLNITRKKSHNNLI